MNKTSSKIKFLKLEKMKKTLLKCASLAFTLLLCSYGYAQKKTAPQKKTVTREYIYDANEADSKLSARAFAEQRLKEALVREVGEFLQSERTLDRRSVMKNGKEEFTEDYSEKIMAITAGVVEMEILNETWNGKTYYMLARMTVDSEEVSRRINEVLNDKRKTQELEELRKQKLAAEAEAARLRRELAQEKNKNNAAMKQAYQQQAEVLGKDEWEEVKKRSFEVRLEKGEDGVYRPRQYENAPDSKTKYEEEEEQRDREQKMLEQRVKEIARKNELARQKEREQQEKREWEKLRQEWVEENETTLFYNYRFSLTASYGFMFGVCKRWGGYMQCSGSMQGVTEKDIILSSPDRSYWRIYRYSKEDERDYFRSSFTAGGMVHPVRSWNWFLYAGAGYGKYGATYSREVVNSKNERNTQYYCPYLIKGLELESGITVVYKFLNASVGYSTIAGSQFKELHFGLGLKIF